MSDTPILYRELASWWPLLSPPLEYEEEAAVYAAIFAEGAAPAPHTLLELGAGGGNNASHLKRSFASVTLVDRSPEMLRVSERQNPECEHVVDYAYLLREGERTTVRHDRHVEGLFSRSDWLEIMADVGFRASAVTHRFPGADGEVVLFVGTRPEAGRRQP